MLQPQLFNVQLLDPAIIAMVALGLLVVSVLAVAGPARNAASLDPIEALRAE